MSAKTGRPYKENAKTIPVGCKVSTEMYERVKKYAFKHEVTVASILSEALKQYLDEAESKDKT